MPARVSRRMPRNARLHTRWVARAPCISSARGGSSVRRRERRRWSLLRGGHAFGARQLISHELANSRASGRGSSRRPVGERNCRDPVRVQLVDGVCRSYIRVVSVCVQLKTLSRCSGSLRQCARMPPTSALRGTVQLSPEGSPNDLLRQGSIGPARRPRRHTYRNCSRRRS